MDKKNNTLFEYLLFIWKKKYYLIGFTIICMVAAAALSYTPKPLYKSTALIFSGNAQNDKLSKPMFIHSEYISMIPEDLQNSFDVDILEEFHITMTLAGHDKKRTENELKKIAEKYTNDLVARYKEQKNVHLKYEKAFTELTSDEILEILKNEIFEIDEALINDKLKIEEASTNGGETVEDLHDILSRYVDFLIIKESYKAEEEATLMEKPELMKISTVSSKNNFLKNTLLGGAFGFQLMLIILVLWKYILDARSNQK